ncbi:phage/plasmid primase, P4 family [Desulfobulbus elongatus]|uniref:phage/plasmid primase, P4 family n=1 Tax=Desulfobulbus elongatus TaxID=53332 RepID=UPI00048A04D0|nr:phage/plasmid primase, P4 family [Desulfobulbus elongatus]
MGWARDHLGEGQRRAIAKSLFEVESEKGAWMNGKCPLHADDNPSFGYNAAEDVFHCLAACTDDGDLITLFCRVNGYNDKDGFKRFKEQFGDGSYTPPPKQVAAAGKSGKKSAQIDPKIAAAIVEHMAGDWELFPPLPDGWINRLATERAWTKEGIRKLGLRLQTHRRDKQTGELKEVRVEHQRIAIPVHNDDGALVNIRLYLPGDKIKIYSWAPGSGEARLFPPPSSWAPDGPIVLAEGEPDTICGMCQGFLAVTQTSKTNRWSAAHLRPFKGRDVIIAYDADQAGQRYAERAAVNLGKVARSVRVICWPDFMLDAAGNLPKDHGQDLTDFFARHRRTGKDFEALWTSARAMETESSGPELGSAWQFFEEGVSGKMGFKSRLLADRILKDIPLLSDPLTSLTYRWSGKFWEPYETDQVRRLAIEYLGIEATKGRVEDAVFQVRMMSTIPHGRKLNDTPDLICIRNGMCHIDTFEVRPHAKDYYATIQIDVDFDPHHPARCDRWLRFLLETIVTPAAINQLQEFFGYCLTRETRFDKCLLLLGPGSDGKSKVVKVLRQMVGPANTAAVSFENLQDQFHRATLFNKMLNVSTEISNKAMESDYFKAIVTGDPVNAAFKNVDPFEFTPFVKLCYSMNKMPKVMDNSDGFYRRLLPISFKNQFFENADHYLEEKLLAELSGIFAWSLVGLKRLRERGGFSTCEETRDLLADYRRLNNPVYAFVEDRCLLDASPGSYTDKDGLYKAYATYCREKGYQPYHYENFFRELKASTASLRDYRPRNGDGKREQCIRGLILKQGEADGPPLAGWGADS